MEVVTDDAINGSNLDLKHLINDIEMVPQVLNWDSIDNEPLRDAATFGTTGCVPGGVGYTGKTQTQIGSRTTQLNKSKRTIKERVKHAFSQR